MITNVTPCEAVGVEPNVGTFQAIAGAGTMTNPSNVNDNNTGTMARANNIGEYTRIIFGNVWGTLSWIRRWRMFGDILNNGDGEWKIERYDLRLHAWVDWVTGIPTRATADWSTYAIELPYITDRIRLSCVTVDSSAASRLGELEVVF